MIRLHLLGSIGLTDAAGREARAVIAQPKRFALLAHLVVSGSYQRRDRLVALFWPELDAAHARGALSQALRFLRRELNDTDDDGLIVSRGAEEVGINAERVWCDVTAFSQALETRRYEDAVALYRGDLLDGFFVNGGSTFDEWLDRERPRLRSGAASAARICAEQSEASGDHGRALEFARRAIDLSYPDERALRDLLERLHRLGDRAGAVHAYEQFAQRLAQDLEATPAAETVAIMDRIRSDASFRELRPASDENRAGAPERSVRAYRSRPVRWAVGAAAAGALVIATVSVVWTQENDQPAGVAIEPFRNQTGNSELDYIGKIVDMDLAKGLQSVATITTTPASRRATRFSVGGSYHLRADSLEFVVDIFDYAANRYLAQVAPMRVTVDRHLAGSEYVRQRALGALAYYTSSFGADSSAARRAPLYPAFLAFSEGLAARLRGDGALTVTSLERAIAVDSAYPEAYFLLGSRLISVNGEASRYGGVAGRFGALDSIAATMRRVIARPTAADRLTADLLSHYAAGRNDSALDVAERLGEFIPASHFTAGYMGIAANQPLRAIKALERLDPDEGWTSEWYPYWVQYTAALHQAGQYKKELKMVRQWQQRYRESLLAKNAEARAMVALGRLEKLPVGQMQPGGLFATAAELAAHGYQDRAKELLSQVVQRGRVAEPATNQKLVLRALIALGRVAEALPLLEASVRRNPLALDQRGLLGITYALQGNVRGAEEVSRYLAEVKAPYLHGLPTLWRARIAARLGQRDSAVTLLAQAFREGLIHHAGAQDGTFWHSDPDFQSLRGYSPYDSLVRAR